MGNNMYSETQKLRDNEGKVLKEIEEQKRELLKREEKLREIEAKLAKGDTGVVQSKGSRDEHRPRDHSLNGRMHNDSPVHNRRPRHSAGDYEEEDERPKVSEMVN